MKTCKHTHSQQTRDGKECVKCGLTWAIALREKRKLTKSKRTLPEDRMKTYGQFDVSLKNPSVDKVKWTKFCIVVPTEEDKKELQAVFEYFHDNPLIDTDFITVNQLVHLYLNDPADPCQIIVDEDTFRKMEQNMCQHPETYNENGINYCKKCWKALEVISFRT